MAIAFLQLGAGFVKTFKQFLGLRALFGIGMGGIWGLAAATALENLPVEARGLASGIIQQGYAVGYLVAAVINLTLVPATSSGWRSLFWTAAGISAFAAILRVLLPESAVFLRAKAAGKVGGANTTHKTKIFLKKTKQMLRRHWLLCIYAVLLMTGWSEIYMIFELVLTSPRIQLPVSWFPSACFPLSLIYVTQILYRISTPHIFNKAKTFRPTVLPSQPLSGIACVLL
jgi:MFS family permease